VPPFDHRDRVDVKVRVLACAAQPPDRDDYAEYWYVWAVNVGQRPIELVRVGLEIEDGNVRGFLADTVETKHQESGVLPVTLDGRQSARFFFERSGHGYPGLGRLRSVWVRDSRDREYTRQYRPNSPSTLLVRLSLTRLTPKTKRPTTRA
jgi:hypothetical protein